MKLYTNIYPLIKDSMMTGKGCFIEKDTIEILFDEGTVFKVIGFTEFGIIIETKGKAIIIRAELFKLSFKETEIDI